MVRLYFNNGGGSVKLLLSILSLNLLMSGADLESKVKHGYADNNGVKIHYASVGSGPLIVMIHGFPDYWYTWRHQMEGLSDKYQVVAIDQRGFNLSDKPKGVENYDMRLLVSDVAAVVKSLGKEKAIIVGHDWGGAVSWQLAMHMPQIVDKLIILNLPHPHGLARELVNNPEQAKEQPVRPELSEGRLRKESDCGRAREMGDRSGSTGQVR